MELLTGLLSGWGAILLSIFMVLTAALKWPTWLHYIWAAMVLLSGILVL